MKSAVSLWNMCNGSCNQNTCPSRCSRLCEQKFVASRRSKLTFEVSVCPSARFLDKEETNSGANVFHQRVICHFKYVTNLKFSREWTRRNWLSWVRSSVLCCNVIRASRGPKPTTLIRNAVILIYQTKEHHVREDSNSKWFLMLIYRRKKCVVTAVHCHDAA